MILFRERQQIVICVIAVTMIGGFVLFRYLPLKRRIKAVEQSKNAQELVIVKSSADKGQLPVLKEHLLKLQQEIVHYELNVPDRRELGEFLQRIAHLMNKHNLKEQLVQPGEELKLGQLHCVPVDVQCKGRLEQIFEFYKSLQGLDRLVRVEQVKLENDRDFNGEVSVKTKTIIYYSAETTQG